ncbi:MAG: hypothetical protein Kow00127_02400 [Bacteroidales bacterium]
MQSFPEWLQQHPGGTWEQYLNSGIPVRLKNPEQIEGKSKTGSYHQILKWTAGGIIFIVIALFWYYNYYQHHEPLSRIRDNQWIRGQHAGMGLVLSAPVELIPSAVEKIKREEVTEIIKHEGELRKYGFYVTTKAIRFNHAAKGMDKIFTAEALGELKNMHRVKNLCYELKRHRGKQFNGILALGKFNRGRETVGYNILTLTRGNILWQISIFFDYTDPDGQEIADKILRTVWIGSGEA